MSAPASGRGRWAPPALWAVVLLASSSWPSPDVPQVSHADKVVHLLLFGVLAFLVGRAQPALVRGARPFAATALALAAFAALDEWHQTFIPGRSASAGDWVADTLGVVLGLLLVATRRRALRAAA